MAGQASNFGAAANGKNAETGDRSEGPDEIIHTSAGELLILAAASRFNNHGGCRAASDILG
jgi:hypothetical protein